MSKLVNIEQYRPRIIDKILDMYLNIFGAVCIEGPMWCGKSWTASYHAKSEFLLADFEDGFRNKRIAQLSPSIALKGDTPRLIDEWQEIQPLWDAVRYEVDRRGKKGQFILTGSSTPKRNEIMHGGAGRVGKLRMRMMSLYESGDSSGKVSLMDLCNGTMDNDLTDKVDLMAIAQYIVRGGFPDAIDMPIKHAQLLARSYIETILNKDLPRMDGIRYDVTKMHLLLRSLARNESTTATKKKLAADIKERDEQTIDYDTVVNYLDVFERLYLLDNQKPFSSNIRSSVRVKQSEKRHFCDPALACAILHITPDKLINDPETFGFMFEALCERDLKIYAESFGAQVYHYRDYSDREVDAVVELEDGRWCAFEIKLGANQIDKAAESLLDLKNKIAKEGGNVPSVLCVICGLSVAAYKRPDGVFVVPITALKN